MTMDISVIRSSQGLVTPCEQTPSGTLDLSVIDRLPVLRCYARTLHVFRHGPAEGGAAAAQVIREALSKALVPYYPLAGRLLMTNEVSGGGQLQIACSGEGVWFVEASANSTTLDSVSYFEDDILSIPYDVLLPDHPPQSQGLDPLVLIQVTQFACDGFVMGLVFCHSICDGLGAAQFLNAVGELARGLERPKIEPVWCRDFLIPPPPPPPPPTPQQAACTTNTALPSPPPPPPLPSYQLEHTNIDISLDRIIELKQKFQDSTMGQTCSAFEIVAAILWMQRTRTIINMKNAKEEEVKLVFFANCRQLLQPPLPQGFYGNCFFPVTITASSETLTAGDVVDVVKLIQEAKARLPLEFANWTTKVDDHDPFAPPLVYATLFISEWGRLGFNQIDYGWGPPVHVVPIQGSAIIPVGIVGSMPSPSPSPSPPQGKGIRLMTWCVEKAHLHPFLHHMNQLI